MKLMCMAIQVALTNFIPMDHHATAMDALFHCLSVAQRVGQSHLIFLQQCCSTLNSMLHPTEQVTQFCFCFWMGMVVILKNHSWTSSMNDDGHKWKVFIGVPYRTNLWQVGNSAQQNGSFKMSMKKVKKWIVENKADCQLDCKIHLKDLRRRRDH